MYFYFRAKVKSVSFLLPVDDIYTNRPVLTKHLEEPKITGLASISETDSWENFWIFWTHRGDTEQTQTGLLWPDANKSLYLGAFRLSSYWVNQWSDFHHTWPQTPKILVTGVAFRWPWESKPGQQWWDMGALCREDQVSRLLSFTWAVASRWHAHTCRWQTFQMLAADSDLVSCIIIYSSVSPNNEDWNAYSQSAKWTCDPLS